jgi:peptide deformylase
MEELSRTIKLYGDSVLKKKCKEVTELNRDIQKLINVMFQTMRQYKGVGLSAPQVGVSKRVIVANIGEELISMVNPRILWRQGKDIMSEGCLSFPGINLEIKRSQEILVEGLNSKGEQVQLKAKGLVARILQHEIDHLDGILIIDRVSGKRLKTIKKELVEVRKKA